MHLILKPDPRRDKRFHFQKFWTKIDGFQEVVRQAWDSQPSMVNPFKRLAMKLKATTNKPMSWSDKYAGSIKQQMHIANEVILRLDVTMEVRSLTPAEMVLRQLMKRKLLGMASLERTIAR